MKASINPLRSFIFVTALSVPLFTASAGKNWMAGFQEGKPPLQSVGQLAFGPDGILFLADSKGAAIVAFSTGDTQAPSAPVSAPLKVERVNEKVAALLGTTPDEVLIEDLAVNPISRNAYLAVSRGRGPTGAATTSVSSREIVVASGETGASTGTGRSSVPTGDAVARMADSSRYRAGSLDVLTGSDEPAA